MHEGTVESGIFDGTVWFYGNYKHINFVLIISNYICKFEFVYKQHPNGRG